MSTNLLETIQKNLRYPPLQKVDPNIQETKDKNHQSKKENLAQAALPAVLAAIYKLTRTDEGCMKIISAPKGTDWLTVMYTGSEDEAVEKIARYSDVTPGEADEAMQKIANEAICLIREAAGKEPTPDKIKTYVSGQRHNILTHLPADLQMGDVLHNEHLDDRTNKMEGPMSNLMHKIENNLSDGDKKEGLF